MNLADVEAYLAVVELGSLQRAAARLGITQPGITRRIQSLERELGTELLDRRAKPVRPSPSGMQIVGACRRLLQSAQALHQHATDGEPRGEFRLGVAPGLAETVLAEPLDRLRRAYPKLSLSISTAWTGELLENVRAGGLQAAIILRTDDVVAPSDRTIEVGTEDVVVAAARGRALPPRASLRDIPDVPWVLNPAGCGYRRNLQRAFDALGLAPRIAAEVVGRELQLSLVARDLGLGLVPRRVLAQSRYRSRVRAVVLRDFALRATIGVVRGADAGALTGAIEALADDVRKALRATHSRR